ncbi:hypothetical protein ROA7450_02871 [Roseovarius albus]|uniref:Lipocalin-like domain-containing protein n=1 Tax=Roseovarius albus TaxID=1247867 RepID=A0A1X6ZMH8_9RHOB|nr:hypothetical protein [Roseovarius albus]SLN55695.1 hypothetical protein ROA7450_02871 [Roseovarius albus]
MRHILLAILFFFYAGSVSAQQSSDDLADFCATATPDLMAALNGTWRLTHESGSAYFGNMSRQDFPAPAPIDLEFLHWSNLDIGILSGEGQYLLMLPVSTEAAADHISTLVQDEVTADLMPGSASCDWYALPAMIGTTSYSLKSDELEPVIRPENVHLWQGGVVINICPEGEKEEELWSSIPDEYRDTSNDTDARIRLSEKTDLQIYRDEKSACAVHNSTKGDLDMTLIVKFSSPNSASGIVSFWGKMDAGGQKIGFFAQTPVKMSR